MAGWPNQVKTVVTEDDYHLSTMHYYAKEHSTVDLSGISNHGFIDKG